MNDLATWLLAQLEADEKRQLGRRSMPEVYGRLCPVCAEPLKGYAFPSHWDTNWELDPCRHTLTPEQMEAFAPTESRADPFVLADIAAKRRIVLLHPCITVDGAEWCVRCGQPGTCDTVRLLALPCADRPGYDPAWAPEEAP